jgi:hypothetical protein
MNFPEHIEKYFDEDLIHMFLLCLLGILVLLYIIKSRTRAREREKAGARTRAREREQYA